MGKGKWIIEEGVANAKRVQVPVRPQDTGVLFAGVRVYVMSDNPADAEVCGKWLSQQPGPIKSDPAPVIMPAKFNLAVTPLEYGRGRRVALGTHKAEHVSLFMQWMTDRIGPPPKKEVIWTH